MTHDVPVRSARRSLFGPKGRSGNRVRIAGLAFALLAGCGDKPAPTANPFLRVELSCSTTDRPWPDAGFRLKAADGREIVLSPVAGVKAEGPLLEGRGAPGRYQLVPPAGWRVTHDLDVLDIRPDVPPVKFGVGRPYTIYAWPPSGQSISAIRCARQPISDAPIVPIAADERLGDDGTASITVPQAEWKGLLRVHVLFGAARFANSMPVMVEQVSPNGDPVGVSFEPTVSAPVAVRVVRAPASDAKAPIELMASIAVDPLKVGLAVPLDSKDRGVLEDVPREVTGLSLFVRGSQAWDAFEAARLYRDVRLLVVTASPEALGALEVRLSKAAGDVRPVLQVRAEDSTTYAAPSVTEAREGGEGYVLRTSLPAGKWRVIVTAGARGAESAAPVEIVAGGHARLDLTATDLPTIRAALVGGVAGGSRWDFLVRRLEGDVEIEGQGFVVRGLARADVDLQVPHGRYRARAVVNGTEAGAVDVDVSDPGTQASIDVKPRK